MLPSLLSRLASAHRYVFAMPAHFARSWNRSRARRRPNKFPKFVTCRTRTSPCDAHGYYRTSGNLAAVRVHVRRTAHAVWVMNAPATACDPAAPGRTPLTDSGHVGSRKRSIHWARSVRPGRDWSRIREMDYDGTGQPVTRGRPAVDIAMSEPGPVYLTLRGVLGNRRCMRAATRSGDGVRLPSRHAR